jgi:hypothetical protein
MVGGTVQLLQCPASQVIGFSAPRSEGVYELRKLIREILEK